MNITVMAVKKKNITKGQILSAHYFSPSSHLILENEEEINYISIYNLKLYQPSANVRRTLDKVIYG